jgi:hypothetical protein
MKTNLVLALILGMLWTACNYGHKNQSWHPRTGSKMKAGHNR